MRVRIITLGFGILIILGTGIFLSVREVAQNKQLNAQNIGAQEVRKVKIGDGIFRLRVAETAAARERGLGGISALAQDEGMLFIFPEDSSWVIWMKDMLIPIDILWLSASGEVIDVRENVSPDSFPAIFTPKMPARFVVELSSGAVRAFHVRTGSNAVYQEK